MYQYVAHSRDLFPRDVGVFAFYADRQVLYRLADYFYAPYDRVLKLDIGFKIRFGFIFNVIFDETGAFENVLYEYQGAFFIVSPPALS